MAAADTSTFDPPAGEQELLRTYMPVLRYDSQAAFYAVAADTLTDSPANRLMRRRRVLAAASGVPHLSLDLLTKLTSAKLRSRSWRPWRRGVERASSWDRVNVGPSRLGDANAMQANPDYAGVVYGRAHTSATGITYLQYWLWFYGTPFPFAPERGGDWMLVQVELEQSQPARVVTAGQICSWADTTRALLTHPVVYVAPFTNALYLDAGVRWRLSAWDGCDADGRLVAPELRWFGLWAAWPGRWGPWPDRISPPARDAWGDPASVAQDVTGGRLRRALRRRAPRDSQLPSEVRISARLEGTRIAIVYRLPEESAKAPALLRITVHDDDGAVVAHAAPTSIAVRGEVYLDLPSEMERCVVRVSAMATDQNRRPIDAVDVEALQPDELEQAIYESAARRYLSDPAVIDSRRRLRVSGEELKAAVDDPEARTKALRAVAAELQTFRGARAELAGRQDAADRAARAARWIIGGVVAAPALLGLALLTASTWFGEIVAVVAGSLLGGIPTMILIKAIEWRGARKELKRWPEITRRTEHAPLTAARATFEQSLLEKGIAPFVRQRLNEETTKRYGDKLYLADEGLSQLRVLEDEVTTGAMRSLRQLTARMRGGSIGIAGARGVGKSTLIAAFCKPRATTDRRLTTILSAPVRYDVRDFILTLFGALCLAAGADSDREVAPFARPRWLPAVGVAVLIGTAAAFGWAAEQTTKNVGARYGLMAVCLAALGCAAIIVLGARWRDLWKPVGCALLGVAGVAYLIDKADTTTDRIVVVLGIVAAFGLAAHFARRDLRRRPPQEEVSAEDELRAQAASCLRDIRFQQSWSQGYSGKLTLPLGELSKERREDVTQQQATFPEIVQRLRAFIALAVRARGGVVIGIDEMDKMESGEVAQRFLNEIKSIFGIEHCFYLVSMSDSAMSSFERRGLPFRDVFDSSFDEVITVEPLPLSQSTELLRRRVLGLTPPFIDLCHCLGGGLPRDVLRVARHLAQFSDKGYDVARVAREVIAIELRRRVEGSAVPARKLALEPDVSELLFWLRDIAATETDAHALIKRCAQLPEHWPRERSEEAQAAAASVELDRLRVEIASYAYFAATVLQVFESQTGDAAAYYCALEAEPEDGPGGECAFDELARAHTAFAQNPRLAVDIVDAFRTARGWAAVAIDERTRVPPMDAVLWQSANGSHRPPAKSAFEWMQQLRSR